MECPICKNAKDNNEYSVKEMQMGLKEEFEYVLCSKCGCLFLKDVPKDMSKYYGKSYGPHQNYDSFKDKLLNKFVGLYFSNNFIVSKIAPKDNLPSIAVLLNNLKSNNRINKNSAILDVGCGQGKFLNYFKCGGFKDLTGIDLFIDDENIKTDITLIQTSLDEFKSPKKYDLIISNHAFEHMDDQLLNLQCFEKLVKKDGLILLRIPVKSEFVWNKYGVNWYQIDAPRHLFLHTLESFEIICNKTNLIIEDVIFDSSELMFINSEKFAKDISMNDENWHNVDFSNEELEYYKNQIKVLNDEKNADQAIFVLKIKSS